MARFAAFYCFSLSRTASGSQAQPLASFFTRILTQPLGSSVYVALSSATLSSSTKSFTKNSCSSEMHNTCRARSWAFIDISSLTGLPTDHPEPTDRNRYLKDLISLPAPNLRSYPSAFLLTSFVNSCNESFGTPIKVSYRNRDLPQTMVPANLYPRYKFSNPFVGELSVPIRDAYQ